MCLSFKVQDIEYWGTLLTFNNALNSLRNCFFSKRNVYAFFTKAYKCANMNGKLERNVLLSQKASCISLKDSHSSIKKLTTLSKEWAHLSKYST